MSNESSFIVSSMYDLLNPDGINVIELGNGKYQLMRPAALSNLHNIAFRSFTGDLLPFTSIELPKLKAELIMMTNGLKSATLSGQDTMDLPAINTYDNTKQNVILSIDKAWVYNKDAEYQVIYNIEEIVELMNEKLKDYFINVGTKTVFHDGNLSTAYINNYKQLISKDDYNNVNDFCSIMYNTSNNKYYIPVMNSENILEMNEVYNSSTSIPSNYDKITKAFFDQLSNMGFIIYENTSNKNIKVDAIRYDSSNSRYVQEEVETFAKPTDADVRILDKDHPTYPLHFFAYGVTKDWRIIGYVRVTPNSAAPTHPTLKFTYYIEDTKYTASSVDIYSYLTSSIASIFNTNNVLHVYGIDIVKADAKIHLIASKLNNTGNDLVYGITITFPGFMLTSSGVSFTGTPSVSVDWNCTLEQYMNNAVYKSIRYNFTSVTKFDEVNNDATMILPNNCYINKQNFRYVYYGNNIFNYNNNNKIACKCFDPSNNDCYIVTLSSTGDDDITNLYKGVNDFININDILLYATNSVNFGKNNLIALVYNVNNNYFPVYSYNLNTALQEEYFNADRTPNSTYIFTMNMLNVSCTAKDNNDTNITLNPDNGGYLCSNLEEFIKLDYIDVVDNAIVGRITIPQIEFASNYVLNFNLKIYSDPYYFNIYTLRDFTQQGHAYNLDVNHTDLYYRASNAHVLNTLEYLILLKYNYNLVKLRVLGFPNSDGIIFNLNENSYVSFKNMPIDNTMNALIIELISDDDEAISSEVLKQLFGKVSLAIDWMQ